jgi:hypothetical protein
MLYQLPFEDELQQDEVQCSTLTRVSNLSNFLWFITLKAAAWNTYFIALVTIFPLLLYIFIFYSGYNHKDSVILCSHVNVKVIN